MGSVTTTVRLEEDVKNQASLIAKKLGINLSTVISLYLRHDFIVKQGLSVSLRNEHGFTYEAWESLEKEKREAEKGIGVSKEYSNIDALLSDLDNDEVKH